MCNILFIIMSINQLRESFQGAVSAVQQRLSNVSVSGGADVFRSYIPEIEISKYATNDIYGTTTINSGQAVMRIPMASPILTDSLNIGFDYSIPVSNPSTSRFDNDLRQSNTVEDGLTNHLNVMLPHFLIQRISVFVDATNVLTFPQNESSLTFAEQWLLCSLFYGMDKAPKPLKWYNRSYQFANDQFVWMNEAMLKAYKTESNATASTATADGVVTNAGHYNFPLGRLIAKAGIPIRYLSGHRELTVYIQFWPAAQRLLQVFRQNPGIANLHSTALAATLTSFPTTSSQIYLGDTLFFTYQQIQDARGSLYNDLSLLLNINGAKTVYHRTKYYGRVADDSLQTGRTYQLQISLPSRSPPRHVLIFLINRPNLPSSSDANYKVGFTDAYGHYLYRLSSARVTVATTHAGVTKTLTDVSFASGGSAQVRGFYREFLDLQLPGRLFGDEENIFSYDDFLQQTPMIIQRYDSSNANIISTARTGLVTSQLLVNVTLTGTETIPTTVKLVGLALVDEYIRRQGASGGYSIVTAEEVLAGGFLQAGDNFISQNTGNIARSLGFDRQIDALEQSYKRPLG